MCDAGMACCRSAAKWDAGPSACRSPAMWDAGLSACRSPPHLPGTKGASWLLLVPSDEERPGALAGQASKAGLSSTNAGRECSTFFNAETARSRWPVPASTDALAVCARKGALTSLSKRVLLSRRLRDCEGSVRVILPDLSGLGGAASRCCALGVHTSCVSYALFLCISTLTPLLPVPLLSLPDDGRLADARFNALRSRC